MAFFRPGIRVSPVNCAVCLASLLCVHLSRTVIKEARVHDDVSAGYWEEQEMKRRTWGFTSRLASRTLGTMWGRQRPSISITLSSLSAMRDTCKRGDAITSSERLCEIFTEEYKCTDLCSQAAVGTHSAEGEQGLQEGRRQLPVTPQTTREQSQSPHVCMYSTASGSPDLWLTDWGFDRGHPASIKHIAAKLPLTLSCNSEGWI